MTEVDSKRTTAAFFINNVAYMLHLRPSPGKPVVVSKYSYITRNQARAKFYWGKKRPDFDGIRFEKSVVSTKR